MSPFLLSFIFFFFCHPFSLHMEQQLLLHQYDSSGVAFCLCNNLNIALELLSFLLVLRIIPVDGIPTDAWPWAHRPAFSHVPYCLHSVYFLGFLLVACHITICLTFHSVDTRSFKSPCGRWHITLQVSLHPALISCLPGVAVWFNMQLCTDRPVPTAVRAPHPDPPRRPSFLDIW